MGRGEGDGDEGEVKRCVVWRVHMRLATARGAETEPNRSAKPLAAVLTQALKGFRVPDGRRTRNVARVPTATLAELKL